MTLEDNGNDLVIDTKFQMEGGEPREFKRVYRKESY
jgi:hypothetical protein